MNTDETAATQHRDALLALGGLALTLFLVSLDQTVVGTAMPKIIADLDGFELYAWVTTAYLLAQTVVLPIVGKLGDLFGRKWMTLGGVGIFLAASGFCGIADSMGWLIAGRGLQGIGSGMIMATVFAQVADIFPDLRDRARYQGLLFAVFALSSVIGPPLGGWITDTFSWRWIFYINLPLGLFSVLVLPKVLPQSKSKPGAKIDYRGALTISISIIGLLLGLELIAAGHSWTSAEVVGSLLAAVIAFAIFIPLETRVADPIIPFSLFRNRTISAVSAVMFLFGIVMFGMLLYTPLYIQGVLGLSASQSGILMLPMSFAMPVVGILVGQIVARVGVLRPFLVGGLLVMSIGALLLTTVGTGTREWQIGMYLFLAALGMGSIFPVANLIVQSAAPAAMLGVATSTVQFLRLIGSTVGTAIIGSIVTSGYSAEMVKLAGKEEVPAAALSALDSPNALVSQQSLAHLSELMSPLANGTALMEQLLSAARSGLAAAIHNGYLLMLVVIILALICSLFVRKLRLAEKQAVREKTEADITSVSAH
ncbi:MAG: MDR family MFS transporter [Thiolinea sp.]